MPCGPAPTEVGGTPGGSPCPPTCEWGAEGGTTVLGAECEGGGCGTAGGCCCCGGGGGAWAGEEEAEWWWW